MNILYIVPTSLLLDERTGVSRKIYAVVNELEKLGAKVKILCFTNEVTKRENIKPNCTVYPVLENNWYSVMNEAISEYETWVDKIFCRYVFASEDMYQLVKRFSGKFYFEHNAIEENEALILQEKHFKSLPFSFSPSYLKYWFKTMVLKETPERSLGIKILQHAKAGICVTYEIEAHKKKRCKSYKTTVISNGAGQPKDVLSKAPAFTDTLKCFMLLGEYASWHGVERICESLEKYTGTTKIEVALIGIEDVNYDLKKLPSNCKLLLQKRSANYYLDYNLSEYHLSFSTLSLYMEGMKESSSLKLRDSMLIGFPVVIGYDDTDIVSTNMFNDYVMQVSNTPEPLNFEEMVRFYKRIHAIENYPEKIRKLATEKFTFKVKAKELFDFLKSS